MALVRCQMQGERGESRERDTSEKNIESELKGIKTGNKTIYKKIIFLLRAGQSVAATVIRLAERVC